MQKVIVGEWGNSLAVRLPKDVASAAGIRAGSQLVIVSEGRDIKLRVLEGASYSLAQMLERVTPENLHHESWDDEQAGEEEW